MLIRYSHDKNGRTIKKAFIYTRKDHKINRHLIDADALRIISRLKDFGYDGYLVGGAVRDLIIGKRPKDFDIVTSAEPSNIKKIFRNSRIIGKRFRLVHIFYPEKIFEVSTFRSNKKGSVGNEFGTMDEDVMRRDFTINALFYDPETERIIDYTGGVKDLQMKKLSPVIPVKTIFREDPVRMLRALKYSVSSGCKMGFALRREIKKSAPLLEGVSPSRLTEEIIKIMNGGNACKIMKEAVRYDLFMYLQYGAADLIEESREFSAVYEKSLEDLDNLVAAGKAVRLGDKLAFFIRDFLKMITDWRGEPQEVYKTVYAECRRFILPMNPPRVELEYAVAKCLAEGGVVVRPRKKKKEPSARPKDKTRPKEKSGGNPPKAKPRAAYDADPQQRGRAVGS